jgi:hypothetical protein
MECVVDARCQVGESPVWDAHQGRLFWVDVLARTVFALDMGSGQLRRWTFDAPVGSLGLTRTGRLLIALGLGVHLFDLRTEALSLLVSLGGVDGFDEDETESKGHHGAVVLGRLLAAQRHPLEALELAHKLLDAGAGAIERLRKEPWPVSG